jgi:hypothetical protein
MIQDNKTVIPVSSIAAAIQPAGSGSKTGTLPGPPGRFANPGVVIPCNYQHGFTPAGLMLQRGMLAERVGPMEYTRCTEKTCLNCCVTGQHQSMNWPCC